MGVAFVAEGLDEHLSLKMIEFRVKDMPQRCKDLAQFDFV